MNRGKRLAQVLDHLKNRKIGGVVYSRSTQFSDMGLKYSKFSVCVKV